MADSFFGFDTSLSNLNDEDGGGGEGSEGEYDALNDETFGFGNDEFDWEVEHEQLAHQLESSRRYEPGLHDISNSQLEATLSQLVLDETDAPRHTLGSSVWRHDPPPPPPPKVQQLKNVCTVEEIERQMRQAQAQAQPQRPPHAQNYFQPRFPVILQRPPGLQGPVPLPFAPQQPNNSMNQMNQPLNKLLNQNPQMNQLGQNNQMMPNHVNQLGPNVNQMPQSVNQFMQHNQMGQFQNNHGQSNLLNNIMHQSNQMMPNQMGVNQLNQNHNQMGQNPNHMAPNMNQMGHNINHIPQNNQMSHNVNQLGQNSNQMAQNLNPIGQNVNQMGQNVNQMPQNLNPIGQNVNQMPQNLNPIGQNVNQMGQNVNQMGQNMSQNVNHAMPNGNQFGQINHFQHMMGQTRMMVPPPGINMPRQNFSPNIGQFNHNFRGPIPKPNEQPNVIDKHIMIFKNQHSQNGGPMNQNMNQIGPNMNQPIQNMNQLGQNINQPIQNMNQPGQNMNQPIQNMNQPGQNINQLGQNMNQPGQNMNQLGQNMNQPGQNMNQPGQNIQNPNLSPNKGLKTEKKQQTRIYNNSKTQSNLTSQNLVQLIQNTHPMLQFNNSFHNATHHPLLNRNQFNNINHPLLNSQRLNGNGSFSNNTSGTRSMLNGDDSSSDSDDYAGLMTQREKQWLVNIQMLQLNTGTPYIHDFYYTVFLERQAKKEKEGVKEAHKVNQQNHPFYSGGVNAEPPRRERHNSARHNSTSEDAPPRTYVPTQFENSLGKLQCGSVTAPRKIIDLEVVGGEQQPSGRASRAPSVASTANPAEVPREMKRTKQLLLDIEALYLILLRVEELNDPLAISNALILKEREEKQKQLEAAQRELENEPEDESNVFLKNIESVQRRPKQDSPKSETIDKRQVVNLAMSQKPPPIKNLLDEDKEELVNKMFAGVLHGDRLVQMLSVRKGRTLVSRFVRRVPQSHARLRALWWRVLRSTPALARRHDDGTLAALAPCLARYIESSSGWATILECCSLLAEAFDPARTPYALTTPFTLSAVCALIEKATTLVNTPEATANERQWSKFLKTLARALKNTNLNVARPLHPLPESKLTYHLKQIDSRSTIEILQRGKAAEFADLTKIDVHEQLVKHLCL